TATTSLIRA
uniref:Uncharacterized protein n=1 Tax=Amphimedon queenslandica TaxID=400682 RepID=A0A1X7VYV8_AMPQE